MMHKPDAELMRDRSELYQAILGGNGFDRCIQIYLVPILL